MTKKNSVLKLHDIYLIPHGFCALAVSIQRQRFERAPPYFYEHLIKCDADVNNL